MRVAIVSDIHGNRQAFDAVLEAVDASGCDEMWCLGDLVGYGAEPDACVELARAHCTVCLAGNHDLGVTGELDLSDFSAGARLAAEWTRETSRPETLEYLRTLRPLNEEERVGLYHASPRDPVWEYVLSPLQAELCLDVQAAPGLPDRAFARRPVVLATRGRPGDRRDSRRGRRARRVARRMALEPRQRRAAPRR